MASFASTGTKDRGGKTASAEISPSACMRAKRSARRTSQPRRYVAMCRSIEATGACTGKCGEECAR